MNPATLQMLIARARDALDRAQQQHARAQRAAAQAQAHLDMLHQYAREYAVRERCQPGQDRDPSADLNQRAFRARLQDAVDAQQREVAVHQGALGTAAQALNACLQKHKSLETLALRRRDQERLRQNRRDQKLTDEFAQRAGAQAADRGFPEASSGTPSADAQTMSGADATHQPFPPAPQRAVPIEAQDARSIP